MFRCEKHTRLLGTSLAALILAQAACDLLDDPLAEAEVLALVEGLGTLGILSPIDDATGTAATAPCPLGGEVTFDEVTFEGIPIGSNETLTIEFDITMVPRACRLSSRGLTFTFDGSPNLLWKGVITIVGFFERVDVDAEITGSLNWELDSRSGTCMADLVLDGEAVPTGTDPAPTLTGSLAGTMCGVSVDLNLEDLPVAA